MRSDDLALEAEQLDSSRATCLRQKRAYYAPALYRRQGAVDVCAVTVTHLFDVVCNHVAMDHLVPGIDKPVCISARAAADVRERGRALTGC